MGTYFIRKNIAEKLKLITVCAYCGCDGANTIDHIHPRIRGGGNEIENLTKACSKCNSYKSDFDVDVFLTRMIQKRDAALDKFYSYSGRYRRHKRRNAQPELQKWLLEKMEVIRVENKYFCSVIGSLINHTYKIF